MAANPKVLESESYRKMLSVLLEKRMPDEWFLVYVLGQTGILVGELYQIRPSDLSFDGPSKTISLYPVRGSKTVKISHKISGQTAGVIERWVSDHRIAPGDRIFPRTKRTAQNMFKRAMDVAGVEGPYTTRSLRHMYALNVALATGDGMAVAKALRKRDLPSAKFYVTLARKMTEA